MVRKPPSGGPAIGPISAGTVSQAIAGTSRLRGVPRTSSSRAIGVIIEPPMPCRKRARTKAPSEPAKAQAIEPSAKTTIASRNTRLAPRRSASQPLIGMKIASATR